MGETERTIRRRTVLIGTGAVASAATVGVVASCGTASTSRKRSPGSQSASGPIAKTTDIPVGGGTIFPDREVVVTQPTAGAFHAFSAICTHMGCTVGTVANGLIMCPCHGSEYSITDGSVKRGPAPSPLAAKQLAVSGDEITVTG